MSPNMCKLCPRSIQPVGGVQPASRGLNGPPNCLLRCGRATTATGPDHPRSPCDFLLGTAATFPEPTLSPKCSQDWLHFPSFPPVSRSKRPPTSLLGTDANPCTRVRHHIRLPERHLTASDGPWTTCTAPDGPRMITCLHVLECGCNLAAANRCPTSLSGILAGTGSFARDLAPHVVLA